MKKKLLVACSHPDDEVLGCGATLNKLNKKYEIHCIYLTNGGTSRPANTTKKNINTIKKVKKILAIKKIYLGNFPDNQLDSVNLLQIINFVEKYIKLLKPEIVLTH